jgi:hypothetical protein
VSVPAALRERPQWVLWRREQRDGKTTKVPYSISGQRASTTDPESWSNYDTAMSAASEFDGIGFVFSAGDPFTGIDLDDCIIDGELHPAAAAIVDELASYSERSPSGRGLHVILEAELHSDRHKTANTPWGGAFEAYDRGRFFTITGEGEGMVAHAECDRLLARMFPPQPSRNGVAHHHPVGPVGLDDHELLDRVRSAKNGAAFDSLYRGDTQGYPSASEADLALAALLAFWTGPDAERIERLMLGSGLRREKWDEARGESTYLRQTVEAALAGKREYWTPTANGSEPASVAKPKPEPTAYALSYGEKNKLILPDAPAVDDVAGHCAWLTAVFNLDPRHPITGGKLEGLLGPDGHVVLSRAGAQPLRFEPAARINTPMRLIETLAWRSLPSDGKVPALKGDHCSDIAYVVRMLCGIGTAQTDEQYTAGIVGTFMQAAQLVELKTKDGAAPLTTYGTSGQRYEAAMALRRIANDTGRLGGPRYFRDSSTGELVIAVSDLADAARRHMGASLPRGWLDARLSALGWRRINLDGHQLPGRDGRQGPHARISAYRGFLRDEDDGASERCGDDISVTT